MNPHVKIEIIEADANNFFLNTSNYEYLRKFNCVVLTETKLQISINVNQYCRSNNIMFLMSNVIGLSGWSFTDFSDNFPISDPNGEECKEQFIGNITKDERPVVETLEGRLHRLETDDYVRLSEIEGMIELNGQVFQISVISPTKFYLNGCNNLNFGDYVRGGIIKQVKKHSIVSFKPLTEQLYKPDLTVCNFAKMLQPYYIHVALLALDESNDFNEFLKLAEKCVSDLNVANPNLSLELNTEATEILSVIYRTRNGRFPPLCAIFGGIAAQEVIKSLTNKFTPIKQWFHFDYVDLYEANTNDVPNQVLKNDRYDSLRICFGGERTLNKLKDTRLFMVGCGAIGCEMLKNYALLGVACGPKGRITITDNDIIEKSNLNRQFLFRPGDIRQSKAVTASNATVKINADIVIKVYQEKVCPQTENDLFNDKFFQEQDICVNALDNVEARRYMDSRCVTNQKALLESGTLGAKGHVQVILPHKTESYTTTRDPQDEDIPYCTLKSFPANIEHCIQWARDKFESSFAIKPAVFRKFFMKTENIEQILDHLKNQPNLVVDGSVQIAKIMRDYCFDWNDCIRLARLKFEKYFSNKAKNLLHCYPLDHMLDDSSPFWKLPKRPPCPCKFDVNNELHLKFIKSCARLYADIYNVKVESKLSETEVISLLTAFEPEVPPWRPSKKKIEVDETKKKEEVEKPNSESREYDNNLCAELIENVMKKSQYKQNYLKILNFEKDDDLNGHIDFIYAVSNLRGDMYSIENSNRLEIKKIAGKIVPAIATTTAAVAGFVSAELVKIVKGEKDLEKFNNVFLNLALSLILLSEPGACTKTRVFGDRYVTLWDKWAIRGKKEMKLREFIEEVKREYTLTVSGVICGAKAIYIPVMPGHAKRLNETMLKLIKGPSADIQNYEYVDLALTYAECDEIDNGNANNLCPPVRYYFA